MGLTPEGFQELLEAQRNACAMCRTPFKSRTPFKKGQRICIDHDQACCPPTLPSRSCGTCVRGLLCLTCNVAVGYIEAYGEMARAYLGQH